MTYAPIDIVFTVLVFIIVVRSALRGFVEEVFGVAWLIFGLLAAVNFYHSGAAFIRTKMLQNVKILPEILAFIILFLIVFIVVKIISFILKDIVQRIKLGGLDHFLGALFGALEGLFAAALILFIINVQPLFSKDNILKDSIYNHFLSSNIKFIKETVERPKDALLIITPPAGMERK
ncbi:MAG: CvpA family protein [Treponema sp.]|jgi:membrane protein required for colicin V production|nr:CvpA family protein [Treponema sp.]